MNHRIALTATAVLLMLWSASTMARVSLTDLDGKLDAILAGLGQPVGSPAQVVSAQVNELVDDEGNGVRRTMFVVPEGKLLILEYVSIFLDVVVEGRPAGTMLVRASVVGNDPNDPTLPVNFNMGYMDEYPQTSRGTPNFLLADEVHLYYGAGPVSCDANTNFGGTNLTFGAVRCAMSGRLIDAPPVLEPAE